ncbi:MAG: hypothetical protein R3B70_34485 [Polyangiaceae bacterium]
MTFRSVGVAAIVLWMAHAAEARAQDKGASENAAAACAPGLQVACACLGGAVTGIQVCREDGTGYSACECPPAGATPAPSASVARGAAAGAAPGDSAAGEVERPVERGSLPALICGLVGLSLGLTGIGTGIALYVEDEAKRVTPAAGIILSGLGGAAAFIAIPAIFVGIFYPNSAPPSAKPGARPIAISPTPNGLAFRF